MGAEITSFLLIGHPGTRMYSCLPSSLSALLAWAKGHPLTLQPHLPLFPYRNLIFWTIRTLHSSPNKD